MKKFISFLITRTDEKQRNNIYYAAFLAGLVMHVVTIYCILKQKIEGVSIVEEVNWLVPLFIMDAIFVALFLFMYVIPDGLFRIRNAFIIALIISLGLCIYQSITDELIFGFWLVLFIIKFTIELGFILVPMGIMVRGIWEDMQNVVGGDYKELKITLCNVLSNKNIITFAFLTVIYVIIVGVVKMNNTIRYNRNTMNN